MEIGGLGHTLGESWGWKGELRWPRPFTTRCLLPKPQVSSEGLSSILQPCSASPLRKHGDRLSPYGAMAFFFQGFSS